MSMSEYFGKLKCFRPSLLRVSVEEFSQIEVFVQNVMIRGLCSQEDWKCPLFVDFDRTAMTYDLLVQLITEAEEQAGVEVWAVVFHVEKDAELIAHLGLTEEKTWFANPRDCNRNVYCVADIQSIIKMQTDALLDEGIYSAV